MKVEQYEATSNDGTKIPYFVFTPKGFEANGNNPTMLYRYGGFEVSLRPGYPAAIGTAWLERGGVYVLANIRGGGEFGPSWHQAALQEKRQSNFDDFIAVAEDLVARKITSPGTSASRAAPRAACWWAAPSSSGRICSRPWCARCRCST